jgi:hypothetical protein
MSMSIMLLYLRNMLQKHNEGSAGITYLSRLMGVS